MIISRNQKEKILVSIDNFSTTAVEHLFDEMVVLKNKDLIIFEVINEQLYRKFPLEKPFEPFKYRESQNLILKLKIHELKSTKISNDTFSLQELLHLYMSDTKINKIKHYDLRISNMKTYNITHAFLRFLCTFLYLKIRRIKKVITINHYDRFLNEIVHSEGSERIILSKEKLSQKIMKLNCKLEIQSLYFNNHKKWLLIYKQFLTIKPRQMLAILFSPYYKKICIYLYNNKNCKSYKKFFSLKALRFHIPYINEMLVLQEFNIIGERIFKSLKKTLLISSFFNLCL